MIFITLIIIAWIAAKLFRIAAERTISNIVFHQLVPKCFDAAAVAWVGWIAAYSAATAKHPQLYTNLHSLPSAFKAAAVAFCLLVCWGIIVNRKLL